MFTSGRIPLDPKMGEAVSDGGRRVGSTEWLVGKLLLFGAAIEAGFLWLAVLGILNSVLSLAVYLRIVVPMYRMPKEAPAYSGLLVATWAVALVLTVAIGIGAQVLSGNVA